MTKELLLGLAISGLSFASQGFADSSVAGETLPTTRGVFKQTHETVTLPGDESMGFWGGGLYYEVTPGLSFGPALYGATTGQRGGFITLGMGADARLQLSERISVNAGYFVGAGGGPGSYTLSGGGLMLRAHAELDYDLGKWGILGVGVSNLSFPSGSINSTQPYVSYSIPFTTLFAGGWREELSFSEPSGMAALPSEKEFSLVTRHYSIPSHVRTDQGAAQHPELQLVGAELVQYLGETTFVRLETEGAWGGQSQGYMQILLGGGYRLPVTKTTALKFSAAAGVAGGGHVDTAGGVLLNLEASVQQKLTKHVFVELGAGYVKAPQAGFEATSLIGRLGYSFGTPKVRGDTVSLAALEGYKNEHLRLRVTHQSYLKADPNWRTHHADLDFSNLGVQLDYFPNEKFYLTGQGIAAYSGEAGAYMTGLVGAGLHQPLFDTPFYLDLEGLIGAAGGGGANVGGGLVWQANANLGYQLNEKLSLTAGIGRMEAVKGAFKANVLNVGLVYNFDLFTQ